MNHNMLKTLFYFDWCDERFQEFLKDCGIDQKSLVNEWGESDLIQSNDNFLRQDIPFNQTALEEELFGQLTLQMIECVFNQYPELKKTGFNIYFWW